MIVNWKERLSKNQWEWTGSQSSRFLLDLSLILLSLLNSVSLFHPSPVGKAAELPNEPEVLPDEEAKPTETILSLVKDSKSRKLRVRVYLAQSQRQREPTSEPYQEEVKPNHSFSFTLTPDCPKSKRPQTVKEQYYLFIIVYSYTGLPKVKETSNRNH